MQSKETQEYAPRVVPSRNRHQRKEEMARYHVVLPHLPSRDQANEDDDSDEPQRSCDLHDDDENSLFSKELRKTPMLSHYVLLKIPNYNRRDDSVKTFEQLQNIYEPKRCHPYCEM